MHHCIHHLDRACILVVPMTRFREFLLTMCLLWYSLVAVSPFLAWWLLLLEAEGNQVTAEIAAVYEPIHRYSGSDGLFCAIAISSAYLLAKRKAVAVWPAIAILVWRGTKGVCTTLKDNTNWLPVWCGFGIYLMCVIVIHSLCVRRILR